MKNFNTSVVEDLRKWFSKTDPSGDWKRINSKGEAIGPCAREPGEPKPKCMSAEKRASLTKKERAAAVSAKRKHDPNPERKGAPINVSNFGKGKISEDMNLNLIKSFKEYIDERCWPGYKSVPGKKPYSLGSCKKEDVDLQEVAAWQRKEGKSEAGGLNRKGIESYRRENPGSKLSMAVTTKPSKLKPGSKAANRRKSFCARMGGMKKRLTSAKTANDPDSRINKALRKWNC